MKTEYEILLFAGAAELAGCDRLRLPWTQGLTLGELSREVERAHPELASLLSHSRWAVDRSFATHATVVRPGQEIALIPPVSGG